MPEVKRDRFKRVIKPELQIIKPQPGPQMMFLACNAEIVFYGGAGGGGKTFGLLLDPLYQAHNPLFDAVLFRRTTVQIRNPGGAWDESYRLYSKLSAHPREAFLEWQFPNGMALKMAGLEQEKDVYNWQGAQVAWMGFDELTHFTETQFTYLLSRVRSVSGVPGRVRATMNPDADSWVREWVDWYIDEVGYPIKERAGVVRYFVRVDDKIHWGNTRSELIGMFGPEAMPKSFTYIPAKLSDNRILMDSDPGYLANLKALSRVDRMRLLDGNWNVRATAGTLFQRSWFLVVDAIPSGYMSSCRFWDRAATIPNESNRDPDWTRGVKIYRYPDGTFLVSDVKSLRGTPGQVEQLIKAVASHDGLSTIVKAQQDPGSAGVMEAECFTRMLPGYIVKTESYSKDKITRAKPVSAQAEAGNIRVLRAPWNDEFFNELENFGEDSTGHDDQVDATSGAFGELVGKLSMFDVTY